MSGFNNLNTDLQIKTTRAITGLQMAKMKKYQFPQCRYRCRAIKKRQRGQQLSRTSGANVPFVDGLLVLLVGFDKPLPDPNEAAIHEAALQQVVDGFEQQRATLVGKPVLPQPNILAWGQKK